MRLRFGTLVALCIAVLVPPFLASQIPGHANSSRSDLTATIQVLVRNDRGQPLSGLGMDDFILTEHGGRDQILAVSSVSNPQSPTARQQFGTDRALLPQDSQSATWILIILAPMSVTGRNAAVGGLRKFLGKSRSNSWRFALFDDAGEFMPFSGDSAWLASRLQYLAKHVSAQQSYNGSWMRNAGRAIEELAIQPGRHAIMFASDFESDVQGLGRNPWLLRVGPSAFVDSAIRAQAAMYTVQGTGPGSGTVVPFGAAASAGQYSGSGEQVAKMINEETVSLGATSSDFLQAADQTGGLAARNMQEAFADVAADAAGYYQITFRPDLDEADGTWHPISIAVRAPQARLRGAQFYLPPTAESRQQIPAAMRDALNAGATDSGLAAEARVWLFPEANGVHIGAMAADLVRSADAARFDSISNVQISVQLVDEGMKRVVGSWLSERHWSSAEGNASVAHWQREAVLYPGTYSLRVVAMDMGSKKIATRTFSFTVSPGFGRGVSRISQLLVAGRCLPDEEREGRANLFDPLMLEGCMLAPTAFASFSPSEKPTVLMRIYPSNQKLGAVIASQWKAFAIVGSGEEIPLNVAQALVRGLAVSGNLDIEKLNLKPGKFTITIVLDVPTAGGYRRFALPPSEFTVTPQVPHHATEP